LAISQFAFLQAEIPEIFAHGAVAAFERYGKGRKHRASLNFGDCLCCACAKAHDAKLLFKGGDFAHTDVARA
jgi:ribonuclease VapC